MTQIAAKLPDQLVHKVDALVAEGLLPSRSWAVRRGLELVVDGLRRASVDQAFRRGYELVPETEAELDETRRLALGSIAQEPWEPWW
jgi:Arc/MetJ-type ribon-helix-helix transcriptional regulator